MYRFALRPAWLISHLLVLALVVAMVNLGLWQLRRLDERQERNELVEARSVLEALDADELDVSDPDAVRFRQVVVEGEPARDATVAIDNRTLDGRPGAWILTAVGLDGGRSVMVNRGFQLYGEALALDPPDLPGSVSVVGTAETGAGRSCAGAPADDPDIAFRYACVDLEQIADDLELDLLPVEIRTTQTESDDLRPVPPPELDDGPHLSYAVQWFIFTLIAVVGYPIVLHRVARQKHRDDEADRAFDDEVRALVEEPTT